MNVLTLAAFGLYLLLIAAIGYLTYHKQRSSTDFIIGNRSLTFYVTALSAHASDMSSWLFMAMPAAVMIHGGVQAWTAIGLIFGMFCNWQFVAPRLRRETERYGTLTLSTYFEARFHDHSGILRVIGALLSLLFYIAYISSGLVGMGLLFEAVFGLNHLLGTTIGIAIVVTYTLIGGFITVCWMDFFQAIFLLAMIILVPCVAYGAIGGAPAIESAAAAQNILLSLYPFNSPMGLILVLFTALGWGLGYFGQVHVLIKFMGIKDASEMHKSKWIGMSWQLLSLIAAVSVGYIGIAFFQGQLANPELVFIEMVKALFHPFIAGFILCALLAATISTMDSQILVLASVLSEDFYRKILRQNASAKELLWGSRIAVILVALFSYVLAITTAKNVMELVFYSWSGLGSTFGPVLILALYSKRVNRYGAITGMLFGGIVAAFWPIVERAIGYQIPALIPGFLLNMVIIYGVSRLTHNSWAQQIGDKS
jgi:sodium/proline symporter